MYRSNIFGSVLVRKGTIGMGEGCISRRVSCEYPPNIYGVILRGSFSSGVISKGKGFGFGTGTSHGLFSYVPYVHPPPVRLVHVATLRALQPKLRMSPVYGEL